MVHNVYIYRAMTEMTQQELLQSLKDALGTTWDGCPKKLEETRGPNAPALTEQALVSQMYSMAWENFQAHPLQLP